MEELDLMTKFNRGLALALVDKNVYEAVQMYRQYVSYLHSKNNIESYEKELITARNAFLIKLNEFVEDHKNSEKYSDLIAAYQELIVAYPNYAKLYKNCAKCFSALKQYDVALELLKKAEKISPDDISIKEDMVDIYNFLKDFENAEIYIKKVLEYDDSDANNFCILSKIYLERYNETANDEFLKNSVINMEIAHKKDKNQKQFIKNLAVLYLTIKDYKKLDELWMEYLKVPNFLNEDKFNYAAYLLRKGDYIKGFELYEDRFLHESMPVEYPEMNKPKYDGKKDISKKTVLVQFEQGFGDTFMFSRFLPLLKEKAGKIIVRIPKRLSSIIQRSFTYVDVVNMEEIEISDLQFDYHLPMMSMAYVFKLEKEHIPNTEKYLLVDENKKNKFKKEYFEKDKNFKIGIFYEGNAKGLNTRDVALGKFVPLSEIEGVSVYSLQYDVNDIVFEGTKIINLSSKIKTFDDTMALISNMDLIISTDNSALNLSGAMGKKTFALFNSMPEWRWFNLSGENVGWYKSVKPYCVEKHNMWEPVFEKIIKDVKTLIKEVK